MRLLLLIAPILMFSCASTNEQKEKIIRVTGEGKIRVKPDLVILTINVSFTKPMMFEAVKMTQQTVDTVVAILDNFKYTNNDIKTSSISANKEYSYNARTPLFIGFKADQSIDFVLNDIEKFTELTGRLLQTKINSISQIQFNHSKADSLFREADLLAYDDALKSANKLCARANVKLGKVKFLSNAESSNGYNLYGNHYGEGINTYSKGYGGSGFKISPEVLEFKRNIISAYEIID